MTQIQLFDSKIQKLVTIDSNAYIKARDEYCKRKNINKSGSHLTFLLLSTIKIYKIVNFKI